MSTKITPDDVAKMRTVLTQLETTADGGTLMVMLTRLVEAFGADDDVAMLMLAVATKAQVTRIEARVTNVERLLTEIDRKLSLQTVH